MSATVPTLFQWSTLRDVGTLVLNYRPPVPGRLMEVELTVLPGTWIRVWQADNAKDYFCHGLTFGGKHCPSGPISPMSGAPVELILSACYDEVNPESAASVSDVLIWRDAGLMGTPHSAILLSPVVNFNFEVAQLDYSSILRTKNGMLAEANATLEDLVNVYGEMYNIYRRRS